MILFHTGTINSFLDHCLSAHKSQFWLEDAGDVFHTPYCVFSYLAPVASSAAQTDDTRIQTTSQFGRFAPSWQSTEDRVRYEMFYYVRNTGRSWSNTVLAGRAATAEGVESHHTGGGGREVQPYLKKVPSLFLFLKVWPEIFGLIIMFSSPSEANKVVKKFPSFETFFWKI
jgi:hypothetical protein